MIKEEMQRLMPDYFSREPEPQIDPYEPGIEPEEQAELAPKPSGCYVYEPEKMHAAIKNAFAQPMRK